MIHHESKGSINSITLDEDGEITVTMVWNTGIRNLNKMFGYCDKVTYIDFSYFDAVDVTSFSHTFVSCSSLKYVNLTNININMNSVKSI